MDIFYVYVYLNPFVNYNETHCNQHFEYEPIYIGKGKNKRKLSHLNECFKDYVKKTYKHNKILDI